MGFGPMRRIVISILELYCLLYDVSYDDERS